jgi:hypothetical protein
MARCDEGYLCSVCGEEVKRLIDSSLYLQYVLGWVAAEQLTFLPESHLRCNPNLSQFIRCPEFPAVTVEGEFDCRRLEPAVVEERIQLITRGYLRLRQLQRDRSQSIDHYPLDPLESEPT